MLPQTIEPVDHVAHPLGVADPECIFSGQAGIQSYFLIDSTASRPGLLTGIKDGKGKETLIDYAPLSDSDIYEKGNSAIYPQRDHTGPLHVVSGVRASNGIGGYSETSYHYKVLKRDLEGRGFCGFEQIIATDEGTGISTQTLFHQEHPFKSKVRRVARYIDQDTISTSENFWKVFRLQSHLDTGSVMVLSATEVPSSFLQQMTAPNDSGFTYFPFVETTSEVNYEVNSGDVISTITTTREYDAYGNPLRDRVQYGDGYWQETYLAYRYDTLNWLVHDPNRVAVSSFSPDHGSVIPRETLLDYQSGT